jgi:trehalose 6-phosphate synthase/phosphatase
MVPELMDERKRATSDGVLRLLDELCADPRNIVFLVSGRRKEQLAAWFAPCEKLGICAEHGYFTR